MEHTVRLQSEQTDTFIKTEKSVMITDWMRILLEINNILKRISFMSLIPNIFSLKFLNKVKNSWFMKFHESCNRRVPKVNGVVYFTNITFKKMSLQ